MPMTAQKAIARRIPVDAFGQGNVGIVESLVAEDFVAHTPFARQRGAGVMRLKQAIMVIRAAFPDIHYTIDQEVAEGAIVALHLTAHGTHTGSFFGIPPTHRQVAWTEIHICRFVDGKLAEHHVQSDYVGLLRQLGTLRDFERAVHRQLEAG
jgi:steroid delta-isomerase-like uncharacterized protein